MTGGIWPTWTTNAGTTSSATTCNAWPGWCGGSGSTVTSDTMSTGDVWHVWATNGSSAGATATIHVVNGQIWNTWTVTSDSHVQGSIHSRIHTAPSPEQVRRDEEQRAALAKDAEDRKQATAKARKLLVECLTREQRECYEKNGYFDVRVQGKAYRIHQGTHGNVRLLDEKGHSVEKYCVQPNDVPAEDAMLSQKLALELAHDEFMRRAYVTRLPPARA